MLKSKRLNIWIPSLIAIALYLFILAVIHKLTSTIIETYGDNVIVNLVCGALIMPPLFALMVIKGLEKSKHFKK